MFKIVGWVITAIEILDAVCLIGNDETKPGVRVIGTLVNLMIIIWLIRVIALIG